MSFGSPPTTSGVVVLSGSNAFDITSSDFPVARATANIMSHPPLIMTRSAVVLVQPDDISAGGGSSSVTTSGVAILSFYPGAGAPYIIPFVINARLFPISAAAFPTTVSGFESTVSGERIYPVLPQYSTIIP